MKSLSPFLPRDFVGRLPFFRNGNLVSVISGFSVPGHRRVMAGAVSLGLSVLSITISFPSPNPITTRLLSFSE